MRNGWRLTMRERVLGLALGLVVGLLAWALGMPGPNAVIAGGSAGVFAIIVVHLVRQRRAPRP